MKLVVGFSNPKDIKIASEVIKIYQGNTPYSHVYIRLYDNEINKWIVYEASYGYLHAISFDNFKEHNNIFHEFDFDIDIDQYLKVKDFCIDSLQKRYGFLTILGILTKRYLGIKLGKDGDKTYICSEFGTRILEVTGVLDYKKLSKTPDYMTPLDLYKITEKINQKIKNLNQH